MNDSADRPLVGERRPLTILFSDLVGSTRLSATTDDEAYLDTILRYWAIAESVIADHGGFLAQREGDGIYAWFGYPTASEHDALHAIEAGLALSKKVAALDRELDDTLGTRLHTRVGVHTGTVVVHETNDGRPFGFGFTVNFAAKVQQAAPFDTVLVSEATLGALRQPIPTGTRIPIEVSELEGSIDAFIVTTTASAPPTGDFVGRTAEIAQLDEMWTAVNNGSGVVATLRGPSGVGKSRIVRELQHRLDGEAQFIWARCDRLRQASPFWPLRQVIEQSLDGELLAPSTIDEHALRLGLGDHSPFVRLAVGFEAETPIELDALVVHRETLTAIRRWLAAVAHDTPTVLVIDDLHWADAATREVLELVAANPVPGMLVVTTLWPDAAPFARTNVIDVGDLPVDDARKLATSLLTNASHERIDELIDASAGSPLIIEALARHGHLAGGTGVREALVPHSNVPVLLQGAILARLESIEHAMHLAQYAAVVGSRFDLEVVCRAAELDTEVGRRTADALRAVALLDATNDHDVWDFHHSLIRDLAYDSLLTPRRRSAHSQVADVLTDRDEPDLALLAMHLDAAHRIDEAIDAGIAVGHGARTHGTYKDAERVLSRTLELLDNLDEADENDRTVARKLTAHRLRGLLRVATAPDAYRAAEDDRQSILGLIGRGTPTPEHVAASAAEWANAMQQGRLGLARQLLHQQQRICEEHLPQFLPINRAGWGVLESWRGDCHRAIALLDRAATELETGLSQDEIHEIWPTPDDPRVTIDAHRATVLTAMGRVDQAQLLTQRALERSGALPWPSGPFGTVYTLAYAIADDELLGDASAALARSMEMNNVANQHGLDFWGKAAMVHMAIAGTLANPNEAMIDMLIATKDMMRVTGSESVLTQALLLEAARAALSVEAVTRAATYIDEALAHAEKSEIGCFAPELHRLRARTTDDTHAAEADLRDAYRVAIERGLHVQALRAAMDLAEGRNHTADPNPLVAVLPLVDEHLLGLERSRRASAA